MKPRIKVFGRVELKTGYTNKRDRVYYAGLIGNIETLGLRDVPPQLRLDVPITEEHYNTMMEEISKSEAEYPVLRFEGELELSVQTPRLPPYTK